MPQSNRHPAQTLARRYRKFVPLVLIAFIAGAFFATGLNQYFTLGALAEHRETIQNWVATYGILANLAFILTYALVVTVLPPTGALLTITGGFLFGFWAGGASAVIGATLGALMVYWATKTAFRDFLTARAGALIKTMEKGFHDNVLSFMFVLRLVPIFPFWAVNIGAGLLGVPLRIYFAATAIGIIPGTFVYASVGSGLGAVLDEGGVPDFGMILKPEILGPILGLALLALIPVAYKKIKSRRGQNSANAQEGAAVTQQGNDTQ